VTCFGGGDVEEVSYFLQVKGKGKAITVHALTGPQSSSGLTLPDLIAIGTRMW
jgi:hypothetical protein